MLVTGVKTLMLVMHFSRLVIVAGNVENLSNDFNTWQNELFN